MAAFFHRFALSQSVDAGWLEGHTADDFVRKAELNDIGAVEGPQGPPGPQGPQGPAGDPASISVDIVNVREASEAEGNLIVVGNVYTALCEPGEVAIGGGYEADFTLVGPQVDAILNPLAGVLGPLGLGNLVNLGDTLDGVSNLSVHTNGPAQVGGISGWEIGTTINVVSDITVRAVCVG